MHATEKPDAVPVSGTETALPFSSKPHYFMDNNKLFRPHNDSPATKSVNQSGMEQSKQ